MTEVEIRSDCKFVIHKGKMIDDGSAAVRLPGEIKMYYGAFHGEPPVVPLGTGCPGSHDSIPIFQGNW